MKLMKKLMIGLLALVAIGGGACSDDETTISVQPAASGSFTDERDGTEYHWVRLGGLDWMAENLRYVPETGNFAPDLTEPYPGYYDDGQDTLYYKLHGGLYDYETALAAVPEGWRLPTDEDWQALEETLGMDAGELTIEGRSLIGLTPKERTLYRKEEVGFVFQFYNLIQDLTVEENIEVVSDISESPLDLSEVLGALELEQYRRRFPRELSGGQQQRAAIARAMIKNPRLLLCDELTGALDTRSSKKVLQFVEKMNRQYGTTVVIITHNEAIAKMADQIIRIRDGRVEESVFNEKKIPAEELEL